MRQRAWVLALLYSLVILYLSLYPGDFLDVPRSDTLDWHWASPRRNLLDGLLNVMLYIPLGLAIGIAGGRTRGWLFGILAGFGLSLGVEWLQLWTPFRDPNLRDVANNAAGAGLGAMLARARWFQRQQETSLDLSPLGGWFLLLWAVWFAFPFVPQVGLGLLTKKLAQAEAGSGVAFFAALVGFGVVCRTVPNRVWRMAGLAIVLSQGLIQNREIAWAPIAGSAAGWLLFRQARVARVLPWLLVLWVAYQELNPFSLGRAAVEFGWWPFEAAFSNDPEGYYPLIASKLFFYTALPWGLRQWGWNWWKAGAIPVTGVFGAEWLQRWMSGRTPELSDPLLCLVGIVVLRLCEGNQASD